MEWVYKMYRPETIMYGVRDILSKKGRTKEVTLTELKKAITKVTGIMDEKKLASWCNLFKSYGWVKTVGVNIYELCLDMDEPFVFLSESDKVADKE